MSSWPSSHHRVIDIAKCQELRSSGDYLASSSSKFKSSMTGMQADVNGMASHWQSVLEMSLTDSLKVVQSCLQNDDKLFEY